MADVSLGSLIIESTGLSLHGGVQAGLGRCAVSGHPLAILIQELTPGLVDATGIVQFAGTIEPLALRLDGARGRWELMELVCSSDISPASAFDLPDQKTSTVEEPSDPPLLRGPPGRPAGISLPWAGRWPPPELGGATDRLDSPRSTSDSPFDRTTIGKGAVWACQQDPRKAPSTK